MSNHCLCAACGAPASASPLRFTPRAPAALELALAALLDWCAGGDIPADLYRAGRRALAIAELERGALARHEQRAAELDLLAIRRANVAAQMRAADLLRRAALLAAREQRRAAFDAWRG